MAPGSPKKTGTDIVTTHQTPFGEMTKEKYREEIHELPTWVKFGLVKHAVLGYTYKDAAAELGKSWQSLNKYAQSPAAKKWLDSLTKFLDDPVAMAKALLAGNAMNVTIDRLMFLEMAKEVGDYNTADRIARDLQEKMGIVAKKESGGAVSVTVKLASDSIDVPVIEAEWEETGEVEDED